MLETCLRDWAWPALPVCLGEGRSEKSFQIIPQPLPTTLLFKPALLFCTQLSIWRWWSEVRAFSSLCWPLGSTVEPVYRAHFPPWRIASPCLGWSRPSSFLSWNGSAQGSWHAWQPVLWARENLLWEPAGVRSQLPACLPGPSFNGSRASAMIPYGASPPLHKSSCLFLSLSCCRKGNL